MARFVDFLKTLPLEAQAAGLREVRGCGELVLASQIACQLVELMDADLLLSRTLEENLPDEVFNTANDMSHLSFLNEIAGNLDLSHQLLEKSKQFLYYWQEGQKIERIERILPELNAEDADAFLAQNFSELPQNELLQEELILTTEHLTMGKTWIDLVPENTPSVWLQFCKARQFMEMEDTSQSVETAQRGLRQLREALSSGKNPFKRQFIQKWRPLDTIDLLRTLNLRDEAVELAEAILFTKPNDLTMIERLGEIVEDRNDGERALGTGSDGNPAFPTRYCPSPQASKII